MALPFFTIGHSNRSFEAFLELLRGADIVLVVDVRKMPGSRSNPQFNGVTLSEALAGHQIAYEHVAGLGGLRGKTPDAVTETNALWANKSFHNYADYALTPPFRAGLEHLREIGHRRRCAIMCSEAVWWRCHRRIIADYLIAGGEAVLHIMDQGRHDPAHLTPGAVIQPDRTILYPAADGPQAELKLS